jgi:hypothetical protein
MPSRSALIALITAGVAVACAAQDSATGTSEADYTRSGGVLGQAPALKFGETKKGTINNSQIDVWAIEVSEGDKFTVVESITRGTLTPDFGVFAGGYSHLASASHDAQPKKLTKSYVATSGGKHFIGIAAYQNRGTGNYNIKVTCTGGPCAGEPFVAPLEPEHVNQCIRKTRECALAKARPAAGGFVSIAKARAAWSECAGQVMADDGKACTTACDGDSEFTCKAGVEAVKYFAGKPVACETVFKGCMEECTDSGGNGGWGGDSSTESESVCLDIGFNGTCPGYAKQRTECGGSVVLDSNEDCHALCHTTSGAWIDDLDVICEESCD